MEEMVALAHKSSSSLLSEAVGLAGAPIVESTACMHTASGLYAFVCKNMFAVLIWLFKLHSTKLDRDAEIPASGQR